MSDIGLKQLNLITKVKKYFRKLNLREIDVSKSSFCYIPSYGLNPGNTKLLKWMDKKLINVPFNFTNEGAQVIFKDLKR